MLRDALLRHGSASKRLRMSLANFSNWLSNSNVPWAAYRGLMVCREIALDKMPGIRPIGICCVFRRLIANCVLSVTATEATGSCGSEQLCAGLQLGVEGAIHGMSALYEENCLHGSFGFLLVDAANISTIFREFKCFGTLDIFGLLALVFVSTVTSINPSCWFAIQLVLMIFLYCQVRV